MENSSLVSRRMLRVAQGVATQIPDILARRSLQPAIDGFYLTQYRGLMLLIASLNTSKLDRLERYTSQDLVHQISTEVRHPVYLSNHVGLRYVVLLSNPPRLPQVVNLPVDTPSDRAALGLRVDGQHVTLPWQNLGHILVAGMTGSGKSVFLRSLVYQALRNEAQLLLSDLDRSTFPMLANHPALLSQMATNPADTVDLIQVAISECDRRAELFEAAGDYPDNIQDYNKVAARKGLDPLTRILVVLDEFSALAMSAPEIKPLIATLGFRARKFGLNIVFAAQEFTKEITGPVREQTSLSVCFRVRSGDMARRVNCDGAQNIAERRKGLAITSRWGPLQTYWLDKSLLVHGQNLSQSSMTDQDRLAAATAVQNDGHISIPLLKAQGMSEWTARILLERWEQRGWITREGMNRKVSPRLQTLVAGLPLMSPALEAVE